MPSCATAKNPRGDEIRFDEASHTYYSPVSGSIDAITPQTGLVYYTSGTTFIHHFFPPFDPDGQIAIRAAQKRGTTVDQIHFEWKQNAAAACELGTRVHETAEDILLDRRDILGKRLFRNQPRDEKEKKLFAAAFTAATKLVLPEYDILGVEKIVFCKRCLIAGTVDFLAKHRTSGEILIGDWKTNKKIDQRNTYRDGRFALAPIEHLENCNYIHYALQLNLYQKLLVKSGYLPRTAKFKRAIFHLTEQGPTPYYLPDLQTEVCDMIIYALERPCEFLPLYKSNRDSQLKESCNV